jgi:hypothetical protein
MKRRSLLKTTIILSLGVLAPFKIFAQGSDSDLNRIIREVNRKTIPYTKRLPSVDKVELMRVGSISEGGDIRSIAETKSIEGRQARLIASVWRSQMWNLRFTAECHEPPYAIKFYSGDRLVLYASICWACHDIVILQPTITGQGFNAESRSAKALLKFFTLAFPKQ